MVLHCFRRAFYKHYNLEFRIIYAVFSLTFCMSSDNWLMYNDLILSSRSSSKDKNVKRKASGFSKPSALSPKLQELVGVPELARTEVWCCILSICSLFFGCFFSFSFLFEKKKILFKS